MFSEVKLWFKPVLFFRTFFFGVKTHLCHLHAHALVQDCEIQSQLRNGLPILEAMMSDSSAYIPNELEHARCFRQERFPLSSSS
jgi:hypothetical protein